MNLDELERLHRARGLEDDSCQQFCDAVALAFPALLALARDGERHRMARTLFSVEDVETALRDSENFVALEEENLKYDAAIDAAMKERT